MNKPDCIASNFMENSIGQKRVNHASDTEMN